MSGEEGWFDQRKADAKAFWEWLRSLMQERPKPKPKTSTNQPPPVRDQQANAEGRYDVRDSSGQSVEKTDNLTQALDAWRVLTSQEGSIVDTATGENITPDQDDNGRYAVLDEQETQVGTYNSLATAKHAWENQTGKKGSIIDTVDKIDVTPYTGHLTDEEVREAERLIAGLIGGSGYSKDPFSMFHQGVRLDVVKDLIAKINAQRLPIFELANAQGGGFDVPTREVKVTKREAVVVPRRVPYFVDVPLEDPPTDMHSSVTPEDNWNMRPMQSFGEVTRANPLDLAMPDFAQRVANKELPIRQFEMEEPGAVRTAKMVKYREEDSIVPREWEETIQVTDEQRVQSLAIVCDISGSMFGPQFGFDESAPRKIEIAVALCAVLISKHLKDDSRYSFRWFEIDVDRAEHGTNTSSKRDLVAYICEAKPHNDDLGGGTSIINGINTAADDVRKMSNSGEIQEILVISDGEDNITSLEIMAALGTDVVLHSVIVGGHNFSLRDRSTTYYELGPDKLGYTYKSFRSRDVDDW